MAFNEIRSIGGSVASSALSVPVTAAEMDDISKRAMLVTLVVTQWDSNVTDKSASADLSEQKGVQEKGVCRVRKTRITRNKFTQAITSHISALRTYHYTMTLVYMKDGTRILPSKLLDAYMTRINQDKLKLAKLVQDFLDNYEDLKDMAKRSLGSLFNEEDYPSKAELASRYSVQVQFEPLPHSGRFLDFGFSSEREEELREQLESSMRHSLTSATTRLWTDVYDKVKTLSERLGNPDSRMREAALDTVNELVGVLPGLNIMEDPRLTELTENLRTSLHGMTMKKLKSDEDLRQLVHSDTQKAVHQIEAVLAMSGNAQSQL